MKPGHVPGFIAPDLAGACPDTLTVHHSSWSAGPAINPLIKIINIVVPLIVLLVAG